MEMEGDDRVEKGGSFEASIFPVASQLLAAAAAYPAELYLYHGISGRLLGCSRKAAGKPVPLRRLPASGAPLPDGFRRHDCSENNEHYCSLLIKEDCSVPVEAYIDSIFHLLLQRKEQKEAQASRQLRSFLTRQLANLGTNTADLNPFLHSVHYTTNLPRAAVLLSFHSNADNPGKDPAAGGQDTLQEENRFAEYLGFEVENSSFYSGEDIFGMLANRLFLLFKTIPQDRAGHSADYLLRVSGELTERCLIRFGIRPEISVGSVYSSFPELHASYREASFLMTNRKFLSDQEEPLLIHAHLAEYLTLQYLQPKEDLIFRDYRCFLRNHPSLQETLLPLSRTGISLNATGKLLNIHRNTMLQRYQKYSQLTGKDPKENLQDRFLLRAAMMSRHSSVILRAGVHIQAGSVQYQALLRLAQRLEKCSSGSLQLQIYHISTAGNNTELLHILEDGGLDIGICGNAALYSIAPDIAGLIELPFLFSSVENAQRLLNSIVLPQVQEELKSVPVLCPAFWVIGSRHITSRTPVRVPEDLKGLRIRTMNIGTLYRYFASIGALPVTTGYDMLHHALETGLADCQENPYANILGIGLYDVQRYINEMVYYYNISPLFLNKTVFENLRKPHRNILEECLREITEQLSIEQARYNETCRRILTEEKGMLPVAPTAEERELWVRSAQPLFQKQPLQDVLGEILAAQETEKKNE